MTRFALCIAVVLGLVASTAAALDFEWARSAGGTRDQSGWDIAVDGQGCVYVVGTFKGTNIDFDPGPGTAYLNSAGVEDIFLAKYDADGNYLWARGIGGIAADMGARIALDGSGNAYIGGWFSSTSVDFDPGAGTAYLGSAGYSDAFVAKYDTGGNYLWAGRIGGTSADGLHDLAVDALGRVYITGYFYGSNVDFDLGAGTAYLNSVAGSGDIFLAKYDQGGAYVWADQMGGSNYEVGNAIILDGSGSIYITGPFMSTDADFDPGAGTAYLSTGGGYDVFLAKYDSSGVYAWARSIGGASDDIGAGIAVDVLHNVYLTGQFTGTNVDFDPGSGTAYLNSAGNEDIYVAGYDATGNYRWAEGVGGTGTDYSNNVVTDTMGSIYVVGSFSGTNIDFDPGAGAAYFSSQGLLDAFLAEYDASGAYVWAAGFGGTGGDQGGNVATGALNRVYLTGGLASANVDFDPGPGTAYLSSLGAQDVFFVKFTQTGAGVDGRSGAVAAGPLVLCQNRPNPFAVSTTIEYQLREPARITLAIYDISGRLVKVLAEGSRPAGSHLVVWDGRNEAGAEVAAGCYVCRLRGSGCDRVERVLLVR